MNTQVQAQAADSLRANAVKDTLQQAEAEAQRLIRRRRNLIIFWRVAILVLVLAGWEISATLHWIDPFFYSKPSLIAKQIYDWSTEGTSQGPLWLQVAVTLEETLIGFFIGGIGGIICGILLGRNKFLADIFSIYIKIANSIPRVVLGSVFVIARPPNLPSAPR